MTSEIMKMSDQAIKVADKFLSEIVTPLVKPSLEELGELTRDQIRYWRCYRCQWNCFCNNTLG